MSRFGLPLNCFDYALWQWFTRGGYLVVRKSRHGWWPHFSYSPDLETFEDYGPTVKYNRWLPPLKFKGVIRRWKGKEPERGS